MSGPRPARVNGAARAASAELRRARTRARLLETTAAVIAERGLKPPSVEEIANAAGVSRGTFYNYFDSPEDLVQALREDIAQAPDARLGAALALTQDPAARIALIARTFFEFAMREPIRAAAFLQVEDREASGRFFADSVLERVLRDGIAAGRFREVDPRAARTLAFGAGRLIMRDMLRGVAAPGQAARVVALILVALGLSEAEADLIAATAMGGESADVA